MGQPATSISDPSARDPERWMRCSLVPCKCAEELPTPESMTADSAKYEGRLNRDEEVSVAVEDGGGGSNAEAGDDRPNSDEKLTSSS